MPDKEGGAIELIFPDNKLECNNFQIYSQKKIDQILEINTKNGKMDAVFVDNLTPNNIGAKEVHLSVGFEDEGAILFVQQAVIPSSLGKNSHINFKTGKNFRLQDAIVKTVYGNKTLSSVYFSSSKNIEIENATVSLQNSVGKSTNDQILGIKGDGDINIKDSICEIHDFVSNNCVLYLCL